MIRITTANTKSTAMIAPIVAGRLPALPAFPVSTYIPQLGLFDHYQSLKLMVTLKPVTVSA